MSKMLVQRVFRGAVLAVVFASASAGAPPTVPDFCFLQVSDIHISPQPVGAATPKDDRSAATIAWLCEQAKTGQRLDTPAITTPRPAFVLATGDVAEYGVIGKTWDNFEACFKPLDVPLYVVPGNHDNTWTSIMPVVRKRYGGDNYSFDESACHFVGLDTASIQEPLPNLEARTLNWLRADLARVPKDRPVFMFQHHPLGTTEFATPLEQLRFLDVIREHNVVLLLMGHGHGVRAERWNGLDSVMGGSTFGANAGYSIISVVDGTLRVVYRYNDAAKPMQTLLEKPIARPAALPSLDFVHPAEGTTQSGPTIKVEVRVRGINAGGITADIDGRAESQTALAVKDGVGSGAVPTAGLLAGRHYLHVKAEGTPERWERAVQFVYVPEGSVFRATTVVLNAGMKARPVLTEGGCLLATTDGKVIIVPSEEKAVAPAADGAASKPRVVYDTGIEIIHAPAVVEGNVYFSSAELGVFSVSLSGKLNWKRPVGAAVYGTPAVAGDTVYVGDIEGFVHAIDRQSGEFKWSKRHATFGIEMPLVADRGVLYFGSWDGLLYAVHAADGSLKWKQPGPAGQTDDKTLRSRYYAPADCPPVVIGERLFVTDRSYRLGAFTPDGEYVGLIAEGVAAIGPSEDGKGFYARALAKGVTRYDGEGKAVWSQALPMGRFPCAPTAVDGRVYVCSNLGVVSALDAADGKVLWQYQAAPQLHVMAPVAADASGNVYVAEMDGSVVEVRSER